MQNSEESKLSQVRKNASVGRAPLGRITILLEIIIGGVGFVFAVIVAVVLLYFLDSYYPRVFPSTAAGLTEWLPLLVLATSPIMGGLIGYVVLGVKRGRFWLVAGYVVAPFLIVGSLALMLGIACGVFGPPSIK